MVKKFLQVCYSHQYIKYHDIDLNFFLKLSLTKHILKLSLYWAGNGLEFHFTLAMLKVCIHDNNDQ